MLLLLLGRKGRTDYRVGHGRADDHQDDNHPDIERAILGGAEHQFA